MDGFPRRIDAGLRRSESWQPCFVSSTNIETEIYLDCFFPQANADLDAKVQQWNEFETTFDSTATWLKDSELKVKDVNLKSTLPEKKEQHDQIRVGVFAGACGNAVFGLVLCFLLGL